MAGVEASSFYGYKMSNASLARGINICLGFSVGALKNATKISEFSLKFELISILRKKAKLLL